jgi:hypothetical protein
VDETVDGQHATINGIGYSTITKDGEMWVATNAGQDNDVLIRFTKDRSGITVMEFKNGGQQLLQADGDGQAPLSGVTVTQQGDTYAITGSAVDTRTQQPKQVDANLTCTKYDH